MVDYDTWLTKPYDDAETADQHYRDWCEANDLDPEDPTSLSNYDEEQDALREEFEVEAYLHDRDIREQEDGFYYEP